MVEQQRPLRVLVVDDHLPAAEMVSRFFSTKGYEVECVYNGQDALSRATISPVPDLILLDVMMPGMNGFEVLKSLRANEHTATIPTILITAKDAPADIEQGLELGADDYLPKPVEPRELLARARSKIEAQQLRNALERRTNDLQALLRVSSELKKQLRVSELLHLLMYLIYDLLPCQLVVIQHLSEDEEALERVTYPDDSETIMKSALIDELIQEAIQDPGEVLSWQKTDTLPHPGMMSTLTQGERVSAAITLIGYDAFDQQHMQLFEGIAQQATVALRNSELYEVLLNYTETLEAMVEERTRELRDAQQLLVRSEKLASVGRLAGGIAHEINNPLQPILINMELMVEDLREGQPVVVEDVDETLKSARRIKRIVDRLLEFIRPRDARQPDMEDLYVSKVLETVISLSQKFFQQDNIIIDADLDPLPRVYGNRDQLEQVFLNMMLNAKAAMEPGGTLIIRSHGEADYVVIEFIDDGSGIAPDVIDKIFEPFISTREEGTGLGLFISFGIIENHQGEIDVESTVGKGTTFTIKLPVIQDAEEDEEFDAV